MTTLDRLIVESPLGDATRSETSGAESVLAANCVVVSACRQRRQAWAATASAAGWECAQYADAGNAHVAAESGTVQIVVVDLEPNDTPPGFFWLCEWLVSKRPRDMLLLVCGQCDDPSQELWARQLGAWAFLPGNDNPATSEALLVEAAQASTRVAVADEANFLARHCAFNSFDFLCHLSQTE